MGSTPNYLIPYIEPGDRLADYPTSDKAQADRLEAIFGTRLIMVAAAKTGNYTPAANADIPVGWESQIITDPNLPYTGGAGRCDWTIKVAGTYLIEAQLKLERNTTNPNTRQQVMVWKNGAAFHIVYKLSNGNTYETANILRVMRLIVNDTVGIYYRTTNTGSMILGDALASNVTLTRLGS